jgi:hypothetical protein
MADAGEGPRKLSSRRCAAAPTKKARFHLSLERRYMKAATIVGIVLVIIGVISLAYQGITYTTHKKAVDIGSLDLPDQRKKLATASISVAISALRFLYKATLKKGWSLATSSRLQKCLKNCPSSSAQRKSFSFLTVLRVRNIGRF